MVEQLKAGFLSADGVVARNKSMEALRCEGVFHDFPIEALRKEHIKGRWKRRASGTRHLFHVCSGLSIVQLVYRPLERSADET